MTIPACRCTVHPHSCHDPATGEDGLCDHCRAGCILVGDGTYHVHLHTGVDGAGRWALDLQARMQRVRENCTGTVMGYAAEYWAEPEDACEGAP